MISDRRRREKSGELEPAVAVRRTHHGDLDALVAQSGDAPCPLPFDRELPFELEAELAKELDHRREIVDDNADVVHPPNRHAFTLQMCCQPKSPRWAGASESSRRGSGCYALVRTTVRLSE